MAQNYDVIIVGCGPVGGMAACYLAQQGLKIAVIEQNQHVYPYPRALNLDFFTMTLLNDLLGADMKKVSVSPWEEAFYALDKNNLDEPFADAHFSTITDFAPNNFIYQPEVEDILRRKFQVYGNADSFFNHSAMKLYRDGEETHITIQNLETGVFTELSANYVLGCDGGGSFVRKQAGISLKSLGKTVLFLVVDAIVPHDKFKGREAGYKTGGIQIVDKVRPTTFLPVFLDDRCRWEFRLNPDDDITAIQSPEEIYKLIANFVDKEHVTLVRNTVYKFNSLIATRWRNQNIFVCGDAAHQTSPFIGQGLNMGMRNTYNLCQKIAMVHHSQADEKILDNYQAECYEPTKGLIKEALFMGKMLFNTTVFANLLRSTVSTIRGKKPVDISPALMPKVENYPNSNASKKTRSNYAKVEVNTQDGSTFPITFFDVLKYRIFCKSTQYLQRLRTLEDCPAIIQPIFYHFVNDFGAKEIASIPIKASDDKVLKKAFNGVNYIVMGQNNNVIGAYKLGEERQLIARYKDHFKLSIDL